jgi:hypothetical protein
MINGSAFYRGSLVGALIILALAFVLWPSSPKPVVQVAVQPYKNGYANFIDIRGNKWILKVGTEDEMLDILGMYGITDCATKRVYVHGSLDIVNQRSTITHELLHAGTCDEAGHVHNKFFNSESETDHEGIYKIADYFTTLLHDNPELAKYLYQ